MLVKPFGMVATAATGREMVGFTVMAAAALGLLAKAVTMFGGPLVGAPT